MAQSLDEIVRELDASYNPSRNTINERINALSGQEDAQIQGLQATQRDAFDDITAGARSRGLGFSGIPLGEQARYTASSFLPAVARVKQATTEGRNALVDTLNNINLDQRKTAQGLRQSQLDRDFQIEQARLDREATVAASRASAAASRGITPSIGANAVPGTNAAGKVSMSPADIAYQQVNGLLSSGKGYDQIKREYDSIVKSAGFGNQVDQIKRQLIERNYPQILNRNIVNVGSSSGTPITLGTRNSGIPVTVANSGVQRLTVR